jgi:polyhydroxyalkanoate synthesis regulator phasin
MAHYIHDDLNNRIEGLSKEEIYALIDEVIASGELPTEAQTAFVTALKSIVDGKPYKIGFCTQAEYNELEAQGELQEDALYIITDDATAQDIEQEIATINARLDDIEERITTGLRVNVQSISSTANFAGWANSITYYNGGEHMAKIDLTSSNDNNQVNILPANSNASITDARVDYVEGDTDYIAYTLKNINTAVNYIEFEAYNISNVRIDRPNAYGGTLKQTTFRIYVKDVYGGEFTQDFTVSYKIGV